jgi:hypothetical protein
VLGSLPRRTGTTAEDRRVCPAATWPTSALAAVKGHQRLALRGLFVIDDSSLSRAEGAAVYLWLRASATRLRPVGCSQITANT